MFLITDHSCSSRPDGTFGSRDAAISQIPQNVSDIHGHVYYSSKQSKVSGGDGSNALPALTVSGEQTGQSRQSLVKHLNINDTFEVCSFNCQRRLQRYESRFPVKESIQNKPPLLSFSGSHVGTVLTLPSSLDVFSLQIPSFSFLSTSPSALVNSSQSL